MSSSKRKRPDAVSVGALVAVLSVSAVVAKAAEGDAPPVTANVLARISDIGTMGANESTPLLSLSPDGTKVAFQVRTPDPASNSYTFRMLVKEIDSPAPPLEVDAGGEFIFWTIPGWGFARNAPSGSSLTIQPKWSPSGTQLAYLRQDKGHIRVWRTGLDGVPAQAVVEEGYDVDDVMWLDDASLVYSGRPDFKAAEAEIDREALQGWLFDERSHPLTSVRPRVLEPITSVYRVIDLLSGIRRAATEAEILAITAKVDHTRQRLGGKAFGVQSMDPDNINAQTNLFAQRGQSKPVPCGVEACKNISRLWGDEAANVLYFLRREGWANNQIGLYRMAADRWQPIRIVSSKGVLQGCERRGGQLICAQEDSLQPRRIVMVDLKTGRISPLYDPNPDWASHRLPIVERLTLRNRNGIEVFSDLVLPANYKSGTRLPLVIVQYSSRGFLRGGTGDENPVMPLADAGFAVLSFQSPRSQMSFQSFRTGIEASKAEYADWRNRWNYLHTLEDLIDHLDKRGLVDPSRVGITGLSDGATTVHFGLVNSDRFAAAVTSSCCTDAFTASVMNGPKISETIRAYGIETGQADDGPFWRKTSFVVNADRMDTPLLIQSSDDEYLGALPGVTALMKAGKPVELIVFPDEHHVKWQPAHRLAVYERTIDWFRFWLMNRTDPAPDKARQFERWQGLRERRDKTQSTTPAP